MNGAVEVLLSASHPLCVTLTLFTLFLLSREAGFFLSDLLFFGLQMVCSTPAAKK